MSSTYKNKSALTGKEFLFTLILYAQPITLVKKIFEIILKHRYKMKVSDAKSAIAMSPLKELFERNAEMAAHTSNET